MGADVWWGKEHYEAKSATWCSPSWHCSFHHPATKWNIWILGKIFFSRHTFNGWSWPRPAQTVKRFSATRFNFIWKLVITKTKTTCPKMYLLLIIKTWVITEVGNKKWQWFMRGDFQRSKQVQLHDNNKHLVQLTNVVKCNWGNDSELYWIGVISCAASGYRELSSIDE